MPSFVLVHGGAHGAWCWERVVPLLARDPRVDRVLAVDLPGHGARLALKPQDEITLEDYVDSVVADILAADLEGIVLVGHSLAGITIPHVAARLPERMRRLVYLSTTNPELGRSVMDEMQSNPLSPISRGIDTTAAFCSDLDAETAAWLEGRLGPQPMGPMEAKVTRVAGPPGIPSTYVLLEEDEVLPPAYQLEHARRIGVDEVVRIAAGHSVFASRPAVLAERLLSLLMLLLVLACAGAPRPAVEPKAASESERLMLEAVAAAEANDAPRAFELMQQAADLGDPEALSGLASYIEGGVGTPADPDRALDLFEEALRQGSIAARLNLGLRLIGSPSEAEQARAVALLEALYTSPPEGQGRESFKGAAAGGLGVAYLFGRGVGADEKRGVALLVESDRLGVASPQSHYLLGRTFESGWGGRKQDRRKAFRHFLKSAEGGVPGAQWNVGMALLNGWGATRDDRAAYEWIRRAAEAGDPRGEISLAVMLAVGQGVVENDAEARDWYARGVARNLAHPLRGLGIMLYTGEGGPVDRARGWAYLKLAADAGEANAQRLLDERVVNLSSRDRERGEAIVADWIAKHGPPGLMGE
ncbi:MAG: alpha/beta fold hydrolase [Myxococcota bacterium]